MNNWSRTILSFALVFGAVLLSMFFISPRSALWFDSLRTPDFTPPIGVLIVVWLLMSVLLALALAHVWNLQQTKPCHRWYFAFAFQLMFSVLWAILFFGFNALLLPMIVVLLMWLSVVVLLANSHEVDQFTFWILVPYLAWVTFALLLSVGLWWIN